MINSQRCYEVVSIIRGRCLVIALEIIAMIFANTGEMVAADFTDILIVKVSEDSIGDQGSDSQHGRSRSSALEASDSETRNSEFSDGAENGNAETQDGAVSDSGLNDLEKLKLIIQDEASKDEVPIDEYDREHWAYQPIEQPPIPTFGDEVDPDIANWPSNAIDAFLLTRMLDAGLQPAPATDRVTLIRRLSFDLT